MQIIAYGLIALAILGAIGTGVYKVKQWGAGEVRAEWDAAIEDQRERDAMASLNAAKALSDERAKRRTIIRERTVHVDREVEKPVYRNICLPDRGLCLANAAILGTGNAGCKPDGTLPAARPPG